MPLPRAAVLPEWANAQVSRWAGIVAHYPGQKLWMGNGLSEEDATYLLADQSRVLTVNETVLWQMRTDPNVTARVP